MTDRKRKAKVPTTPKSSASPARKKPATGSAEKTNISAKQQTLDAFFTTNPSSNIHSATAARSNQTKSDEEEWEEWPPDTFLDATLESSGAERVVTSDDASIQPYPMQLDEALPQTKSEVNEPSQESPRHLASVDETAPPNSQPSNIMMNPISSQPRSSVAEPSCMIDPIKFSSADLPSYWRKGSPTPYRWLVEQFAVVEKVTGRQVITDTLTNMLRTILRNSPDDLLPALYLASNSIAPAYQGVELGIGPQILVKAITSISDMSSKTIKAAWDQKGDWGDVVFTARVNTQMLVKPKALEVKGVFQTLRKIAELKGQGTVNQKTALVKKMMVACQGEELRYLTRTLVSHLRIGAVRTTILIALSRAILLECDISNNELKSLSKEQLKARCKEAEQILKECFAQVPNYDIICPLLLNPDVGLRRIADVCQCTPGVPIRPMLGKITRDLTEVFEKLEGLNYCADFKYDGQRAQIHRTESGEISIFSRHLETITDKYPDIVSLILSIIAPSTTSFILDSEVVAIDEQGNVLPFQTLSNRGRKNVDLADVKVSVCVFAFDLMYLNGESLIKMTFRRRRDAMRAAFQEIPGKFAFVPQLESKDPDEMHDFLKRSLEAGCEGLMVKILDSPQVAGPRSLLATYEPDKRTESWLKVKKDYLSSLADSFDLVPIGAWYGTGRKATWYSPYLMAAWNPETEVFESFCKCMSGFSDAFYKAMKEKYSKNSGNVIESPKSYYAVSDSLRPDVWFLPLEVWEIRGADLTVSPVHQAAMGKVEEGRGISLRFPRFIRVREDKNPEDATNPDQIVNMFFKQRTRTAEPSKEVLEDEEEEEEEAGLRDEEV